MINSEIFPVLSGILLGSVLSYLRLAPRASISFIFAVLFGAIATIASGEFTQNWIYLLVDTSLVGASTAISLCAVRGWHWAFK